MREFIPRIRGDMAWFSAKIGAQMQALREDPGTGIPLLPDELPRSDVRGHRSFSPILHSSHDVLTEV